jgi:chemotaxis methyl-accepting protein methylase/chemotaxis receptor (MCP) glutamine deamidase CheD
MIFEHYQRSFLEKRISYRMKHLNLEYYQQYISYINSHPEEVDLFLDKFTINYTYFFRNFNVFESFEKFLKIYAEGLKRPLKIWSAPCATGDEPYSIAIILDQIRSLNKNFPDFEIKASDIDKNALKLAKEGIYGEYAIHETPNLLLDTYFSKRNTELGPKYVIDKRIREKIKFIQEDIIKGQSNNEKFDVIFCRNFIIYINQYAREKLMNVLESRLRNGGLLILGGSETFAPKRTCFETISIRDRFYIKNLSSMDDKFKRKIYSSFQSQEARQDRKSLDKNNQRIFKGRAHSSEINEKSNKIEHKIQSLEKQVRLKPIKALDFEKELETTDLDKKIKMESPNQESTIFKNIPKNKKIEPAELRITGIVVNNRNDITSPKNKKGPSTNVKSTPLEKKKMSQIEEREKLITQREEVLNSKELILEKREERLEQQSIFLEREMKRLEQRRKNVQRLYRNAREKEMEVDDKVNKFDQLRKRLEKREQVIEQKERQLQDRLNQVGQYSRQIIQREVQININSKEIELREEGEEFIAPFDEKRYDRVEKANNKKEYLIPMGYYSLINSFDKDTNGTKFSIQGLGSSIALILKDPVNNIFAMSHISLPDSSASKQGYHLLFPHTFADTSVKDLFNNLLYNGAKESNISALIVGGAKLFLDYDITYKENLDAVKKELIALDIEIEAEDTGGLSERAVVYDTINDALYVRKTWEFQYRKIA